MRGGTVTATCPECGFTTRPVTSQKWARSSLAKHSCDKQRRRAESRARGVARAAAADQTRRECHHKVASHSHGTPAAYVLDRCRCPECKAAANAYERRRRRLNGYGRQDLVDATRSRAHVAALLDAGLGLKRIAEASGVPHGSLWKLWYGKPGRGPSKRVRRSTEDRLLTVRLDAVPALLPPGHQMSGVGTRRRVQALACLGWSVADIAARADIDPQRLYLLCANPARGTTAGTAAAVAAVYEQWWATPAPHEPAQRTRMRAAKHRWAPPMAWDDDTIDDPTAAPAGTETRRTSSTLDDLHDCASWGLTLGQAADRLGTRTETLRQRIHRADPSTRADLLESFARNQRASEIAS